ncbi:hypothetical protein LFL96_16755 [Paraburkholderia sp. D15]|uniref:hypothetical protein n=1 Tax=Paraburkholderia sp. D15 TaxID=2880218 RepID=UPI002479CA3A|nr:hypothetical protein [Paraburkholderia sp. D15]WGS49390.1 hypothetical protein LFL96_16755 [Paraburkholderia sp. D15]
MGTPWVNWGKSPGNGNPHNPAFNAFDHPDARRQVSGRLIAQPNRKPDSARSARVGRIGLKFSPVGITILSKVVKVSLVARFARSKRLGRPVNVDSKGY